MKEAAVVSHKQSTRSAIEDAYNWILDSAEGKTSFMGDNRCFVHFKEGGGGGWEI
jgi:hypothetical protein